MKLVTISADGFIWVTSRSLLPNRDGRRFQREGNYWCFVLRPDPEIDFHSSWIGFTARQGPFHRIVNLMGFWIAGPFHDHEMGIVVLV